MEPKALLRSLFDAAVNAALPKPEWFEGLTPPKGRTVVIGAGKAAASMAKAFETYWDAPLEGLVVTRYGHAVATEQIEVVEAAHPIPNEVGLNAARRILTMVHGLTSDDLVVALISGGGSSLLTLPAQGVTLEEKQAVNRALLRSGASIVEINAVRKSLSAIKGGRLLAAAQPARVVTYVISDVPGDDLSVVASGPTVPDHTPPREASRIAEKYGIKVPKLHEAPVNEGHGEAFLVASARMALEAAARKARKLGIEAEILSDAVEGESREVAEEHARIALQIAAEGRTCVLLSGGETTVTVRGDGRGGRNVEYLAALAQALNGHPKICALAADTDGIDGVEAIAGAFIDPTTVARAGTHLPDALARNDAHALFEFLGDQIVTGPTHTNVNDFRAILIAGDFVI